ncbi:MAG TPA: M28 family peptidase [Coriobacteriia bacterium]|nr:M28 family peptidase [Coriobacteriia bacterium]
MSQAAEHVHHLATVIGPRPATTDAEAEAAEYIESVLLGRGMEVERQEFECPRTYGWTYALYHALTIAAAVASGWDVLRWPAFAVSALVAFSLWRDLDTRSGLSRWLPPKGPSQNVIARHVPRSRRGERAQRVVIVAHYDTARASLAFAPSLVKNFATTFALMKWLTIAVPVFVLAGALAVTAPWDPYLWYATMAVAAYLLVPLLINVHRELAMSAVDGANDNASGVAVMLGVAEHVAPAAEDLPAPLSRPSARAGQAARESGVPGDDESAPVSRARSLEFETVEFEAVGTRGPAPEGESDHEPAESVATRVAPREESPRRRGLLGRFTRTRAGDAGGVGGWLGVSQDFDARDEGRKIGSWENFEDEGDGDDFGRKGGRAGGDPLGDPEYAAAEASRIRRKVTESVDRALADKEVWFVATGAEEAGTWGMRAFLSEYGPDLEGALIINLDNLGTGTVHIVTEEGMARRYRSDRRMVSAAKRVSRENDLPVRARPYVGMSTDATPALARGFRAMSVMAFDADGRLPNWHWHTDTEENVDPEVLEIAVRFVTETVREL